MMRRAVACLALLAGAAALATAVPAGAADFDVGRLMDLLKSQKAGKATFHETQHIAILERPVESTGELLFTPPDRLEKRSTGLNAERMVVDRETLSIERGGRKQTLALREHPQIAVFIESIRGTLAGDRASLEKTYKLALEGDAQRWRLVLIPRDAQLARIVSRIVISGNQAQVRRIEIEQADGDRSVMVVTPVSP
jgi:outer membrane lipoprotein-sorting protein